MSETRDRNLFHPSPAKEVYQGAVMSDAAVANVNAVVGIPKTRCKEVCAQLWLFAFGQKPIVIVFICVHLVHMTSCQSAQTLSRGSPMRARRQALGLSPAILRKSRVRCD